MIFKERKKYGLRYHVMSTIHACQGDTLLSMATDISHNNENFKICDKGQMVIILSCKKRARDTILVKKRYTCFIKYYCYKNTSMG